MGMASPAIGRWPGRIAVGVVRGDPPQIFLADSEPVLSRLLALELVAQTRPEDFKKEGMLASVREALLEERWADAVMLWMEATGEAVDGYPDEPVWTEQRLDTEKASLEIRVAPVFRD